MHVFIAYFPTGTPGAPCRWVEENRKSLTCGMKSCGQGRPSGTRPPSLSPSLSAGRRWPPLPRRPDPALLKKKKLLKAHNTLSLPLFSPPFPRPLSPRRHPQRRPQRRVHDHHSAALAGARQARAARPGHDRWAGGSEERGRAMHPPPGVVTPTTPTECRSACSPLAPGPLDFYCPRLTTPPPPPPPSRPPCMPLSFPPQARSR